MKTLARNRLRKVLEKELDDFTHTPPGTEVICINDDPDAFTNPKFYYLGDLKA